MSGKNQFFLTVQFQTTNPATGFIPNPQQNGGGSVPSGVTSGTMTDSTTIYSQIIDVSRMDNIGISVTYTGTATGTIQVQVANSDLIFYPLTFNPVLAQPAGSSGGYFINLTQLGSKFIMLSYTNSSGSGTLTATAQMKDLN